MAPPGVNKKKVNYGKEKKKKVRVIKKRGKALERHREGVKLVGSARNPKHARKMEKRSAALEMLELEQRKAQAEAGDMQIVVAPKANSALAKRRRGRAGKIQQEQEQAPPAAAATGGEEADVMQE